MWEWLSVNAVYVVPAAVAAFLGGRALLRKIAAGTANTWDDKIVAYLDTLDPKTVEAKLRSYLESRKAK